MAMPYVHRSNILFKVVCIVNVKKTAGVVVVILIIFFVIAQPKDAANIVHDIIDWLKWAAIQVVNFLKGVFHGNG
jgi:uncharacterized membrane protein